MQCKVTFFVQSAPLSPLSYQGGPRDIARRCFAASKICSRGIQLPLLRQKRACCKCMVTLPPKVLYDTMTHEAMKWLL